MVKLSASRLTIVLVLVGIWIAIPERLEAAPPPRGSNVGPQLTTGPAIPPEQALALARGSLIAMQQANETSDFEVLWTLGAPSFRAANPPEKLARLFAGLKGRDLNAILVLEPTWVAPPHVEKGFLTLKGSFNIERDRLDFVLIYQPVDGRWRLFGIGAQLH